VGILTGDSDKLSGQCMQSRQKEFKVRFRSSIAKRSEKGEACGGRVGKFMRIEDGKRRRGKKG